MKKLINADMIREKYHQGERELTCLRAEYIVTPEARTVAAELGFMLNETGNASLNANHAPAMVPEIKSVPVNTVKTPPEDAVRLTIRQSVLNTMPEMSQNTALVDQLVDKVMKERLAEEASNASTKAASTSVAATPKEEYDAKVIAGGIKRISGPSIKMGPFEAGVASEVHAVSLVTGADGSNIAAGMMQWENCFFPWTLNYDEINYIIEGELHIRCDGQTVVAKAGDVLFIPKKSSIEFGTPSHVKFFYVAHPVNWSEC